jgi:hypothetical protein
MKATKISAGFYEFNGAGITPLYIFKTDHPLAHEWPLNTMGVSQEDAMQAMNTSLTDVGRHGDWMIMQPNYVCGHKKGLLLKDESFPTLSAAKDRADEIAEIIRFQNVDNYGKTYDMLDALRIDAEEREKMRLEDERIEIARRYVEQHAEFCFRENLRDLRRGRTIRPNLIRIYEFLLDGFFGEVRVEHPNFTGILPMPLPVAEIEIGSHESATGNPILFTFSHEDLINE